MKKVILLAGFCLYGSCIFGQSRKATVGLEIGTKVTRTEQEQTGTGFGAGVFADLPLYRKLGLSTGLRLAQLNYSEGLMCVPSPDFEGNCPYQISRFYMLELPVGFNLDLSIRPDVNWKVLLKSRYILGRNLASESILVRDKSREKGSLGRFDNPIAFTHGAEFGVELQGFATKKYMFGLGPSIRFTQLLHREFNKTTVFGFDLKFGRNLKMN